MLYHDADADADDEADDDAVDDADDDHLDANIWRRGRQGVVLERRSDFPVYDSPGAFADSRKEAKGRIWEFSQNKNKNLLRTNFLFTTRSCTTKLSTLMIMTTMMTMVWV